MDDTSLGKPLVHTDMFAHYLLIKSRFIPLSCFEQRPLSTWFQWQSILLVLFLRQMLRDGEGKEETRGCSTTVVQLQWKRLMAKFTT